MPASIVVRCKTKKTCGIWRQVGEVIEVLLNEYFFGGPKSLRSYSNFLFLAENLDEACISPKAELSFPIKWIQICSLDFYAIFSTRACMLVFSVSAFVYFGCIKVKCHCYAAGGVFTVIITIFRSFRGQDLQFLYSSGHGSFCSFLFMVWLVLVMIFVCWWEKPSNPICY